MVFSIKVSEDRKAQKVVERARNAFKWFGDSQLRGFEVHALESLLSVERSRLSTNEILFKTKNPFCLPVSEVELVTSVPVLDAQTMDHEAPSSYTSL